MSRWTTQRGRKKLRKLLEAPVGPDGPTLFGGGDMQELLDALEASEARHVRYLNGIEAPLRGVRKLRESGEPAASDANEIWNLVGSLDRLKTLNDEDGLCAHCGAPKGTRTECPGKRSEPATSALDGVAATLGAPSREDLGRKVREIWIEWAKEQENPKESWLVGWDALGESDKEVDRRIGEGIFRAAPSNTDATTWEVGRNEDGSIDEVLGRGPFHLEDMGGSWDLHLGPVHLALVPGGIELDEENPPPVVAVESDTFPDRSPDPPPQCTTCEGLRVARDRAVQLQTEEESIRWRLEARVAELEQLNSALNAEVVRLRSRPRKERLPRERVSTTQKFEVGGHAGYFTVGMYPDGRPGELFVVMAKQGSTLGGLIDAFATAFSIALQYGVPIADLVDKFSHSCFEPSGFTGEEEIPFASSVVDYIARWLGRRFCQDDTIQLPLPSLTLVRPEPAPAVVETTTAMEDLRPPERVVVSGPPCQTCGSMTERAGACYACRTCGGTTGCS